MPHARHTTRTHWGVIRLARRSALALMAATLFWIGANIVELATGQRLLPWNPYAMCGASAPGALPATVRVGLYEEFPNPWRLAKLEQLDFPATLAIGTSSREQFVQLRDEILRQYPLVHEVYFWPLLAVEEGYYPGTWSDHKAVRRVAAEAEAMPVLWDLEMPLKTERMSLASWPQNYAFLDQWLRGRSEPVHLWRSHDTMGLDPLFLRLIGMHYDPQEYASVRMHLDLYANGQSLSDAQMARVLRCGVERYGEQFIPSFGVLNDGEGAPSYFVSPEILLRDLRLAREAGVSEVWLFGVNGLNEAYISAIREALPIGQQTVASGE